MSFKNYSNIQYVREIDTNETVAMGSFSLAKNILLGKIGTLLYIQDVTALSGNETVKIGIYPDSLYQTKIFESSEHKLSDITNLGTTNWIGYIYLDFNKYPLNKNITYYAAITLNNYINNNNDKYVAVSYDASNPIYGDVGNPFNQYPLTLALIGNVI